MFPIDSDISDTFACSAFNSAAFAWLLEKPDANKTAIIKLPTQNTNKEYYAFKIPNENNTEMNNFMQKFQGIYKLSPYDPNNISTLGGRMELDYSRIFN